MNRRIYSILQDGKEIARTFAWNTARRAIRDLVREQLLNNASTADLFSHDYTRDEETKAFVNGSEIWHTSDGRTLVFEIKQVQ